MKKYIFILLGVLGIFAGYWAKQSNKNSLWITIYPPPPKQILMGGLPYLFWFLGIALVLFGIVSFFRKK